MIALIDCNSFFVSCEKLFRPDLVDKPVVVLSNNDGCIVALSKEVKQLGIKRAEPYFKVKDELAKIGTHVFSSNYTLYQSLSNRVMNMLHELTPETEVYSIDEAFIRLDGIRDYLGFCQKIKKAIERGVGIPISIGIARTKTLAKLAMEYAKNNALHVFYLKKDEEDSVLSNFPVREIWGIGRKTADMLRIHKMKTALLFRDANPTHIRNKYSLSMWKIQEELKGIECFGISDVPSSRKGILSSCSFSRPVTNKEELYRSLAAYANNAIYKLQRQNSVARNFTFYIKSKVNHESFGVQYKNYSKNFTFSLPTAHLPDLLPLIRKGLDEIFQAGLKYAKAGVSLTGLEKENRQIDLFKPYNDKKEKLIEIQKTLQHKYGRESFGVLPAVIKRDWDMKREYLSPSYTTKWSDLPVVKA